MSTNGKEIVTYNLSTAEQRLARDAIEEYVHGLPATERAYETYAEKAEGIASCLLKLARKATNEHPRSIPKASDLFKRLTGYAEEHIKTVKHETNIKRAAKGWVEIKSDMLEALIHGVNPSEIRSASAFRLEGQKKRQERIAKEKPQALPAPIPEDELEKVDRMLDRTGIHDVFRTDFGRAIVMADQIKGSDKRKEAQKALRQFMNKLATLMVR